MRTSQIFELADYCIERGWIPSLVARRYVLSMDVAGSGRAIIRKAHVDFPLHIPCRVWLRSGKVCVLLGDSSALPASDGLEVWPPYTS